MLSALRGRWALALDRVRWMETRALRPDQVSRNVLSNALPRWRLALFHADLEAYSGAWAGEPHCVRGGFSFGFEVEDSGSWEEAG